jgi:hypothetical protein
MVITNPRPQTVKSFLEARFVSVAPQPVSLSVPNQRAGSGHLTVQKENGAVKGFEYTCVCGQKNSFVCE